MRNCKLRNLLAGLIASTTFCSAASASQPVTYTDYARVVQVERSFRIEQVREPQRVCEFVPDRPHRRSGGHNHQHRYDAGNTIVGGIIGGAIGHHLTRSINGRSNAGATLAGAALGAGIANAGHSRHNQPGRYHDNHRRTGRRHCTTTTITREHRVADGYDVTYVYRGNQFQTHTRNHPGKRIPVTITISAGSH